MPRFRSLARLSGVLAGLLFALTASPVSADNHPHTYLALGDSVAFGYNPTLDFRNISNFVGYPDVVADQLRPRQRLFNASCPGETSAGFISLSGVDNGCRGYRSAFPLHVSYSTSQLDYTVSFLREHSRTDLVTIDIGANDLFILLRTCTDGQCITDGIAAVGANLATIYSAIRHAGYSGDLVAVSYYLTNYRDGAATELIGALNAVIAQVTLAFGGVVADGFGSFQAAAEPFRGDSCAAGLLVRLTATTCDIHPSPTGRDLLAAAVVAALGGPHGHHG